MDIQVKEEMWQLLTTTMMHTLESCLLQLKMLNERTYQKWLKL